MRKVLKVLWITMKVAVKTTIVILFVAFICCNWKSILRDLRNHDYFPFNHPFFAQFEPFTPTAKDLLANADRQKIAFSQNKSDTRAVEGKSSLPLSSIIETRERMGWTIRGDSGDKEMRVSFPRKFASQIPSSTSEMKFEKKERLGWAVFEPALAIINRIDGTIKVTVNSTDYKPGRSVIVLVRSKICKY